MIFYQMFLFFENASKNFNKTNFLIQTHFIILKNVKYYKLC